MGDKVINEIVKILNSKFSILKLSYLIIFFSCDESPPYVQLIYPIDGMSLNEVTALQAEAHDDVNGKIVSVEFYVDGQLINPVITRPNEDGIWECPFNVSLWADGNEHNIDDIISYACSEKFSIANIPLSKYVHLGSAEEYKEYLYWEANIKSLLK